LKNNEPAGIFIKYRTIVKAHVKFLEHSHCAGGDNKCYASYYLAV